MNKYDHSKIEKKWQNIWKKTNIYKTKEGGKKPKSYVLDMFPYPSGAGLHVGHPKGYIATDIYSRFKTMKGFNVLHPMGWDAFGLPAEEYAIKNKIHPSIAVKKNVKRYKEQLSILGFNYDWSREVNTTDPEYYKWTQWAFLQMFKKGLTFESHEPINWCPSCKTGLANEDLEDGKCERCGSVVEQKPIRQWVIKITEYADRLLKDLEGLRWPESIKESQKNWIGRSEGVNFKCLIKDLNIEVEMYNSVPQTYFAETFTVIAPEHPLVLELIKGTDKEKEVLAFVENVKKRKAANKFDVEKDMEGIFTGRYIKSFADTGKDLPIWIASYVVMNYGTGIVNCSAHDVRDFAFAKKYNIPLHPVMFPSDSIEAEKVRNLEYCYAKDPEGVISEPTMFQGRRWQEARKDIIDHIVKNNIGSKRVNYKLRDWVFSRQRYWGEPIPLIHCPSCVVKTGTYKVKTKINFYHKDIWSNLISKKKTIETRALNPEEKERYFGDVNIGDVIHGVFKDQKTKKITDERIFKVLSVYRWNNLNELFDDKESLKAAFPDKKFTSVEALRKNYASLAPKYDEKVIQNGIVGWKVEILTTVVPVPEKELPLKLPNVKSYEPTGTGESPLATIDKWVNVKCPACKCPAKRETNTMPQWAGSCWYYLRYIDPKNKKTLVDPKKEKYWQPVDMYVGGAEHATRHLIYARFWHKFLYDIGAVTTKEPFMELKNQGLIAGPDGRKMSKRYGNVVNPDDIVKLYGADSLRVYEMFMGPFEQGIAWSTDNMIGSRRFIEKVWRLSEKATKKGSISTDTEVLMHKTIKKVGEDIDSFAHNTAISSLMIFTNALEKELSVPQSSYETLLKLIAPFAPHVSDELWSLLGHKKSIHLESWPVYDGNKLQSNVFKIVVQINSKVRAIFESPTDIEAEVVKKALALSEIKSKLGDTKPSKVVYVKGKLVNLVVTGL